MGVLSFLAVSPNFPTTILAETASSADEFDLAQFKAQIEDMEKGLAQKSAGDELDHAIALLDRYKSIHSELSPPTAF